jgi:hypothetical protein
MCSIHRRDEKNTQKFNQNTWREENTWDTSVDGRIILKWILKKEGGLEVDSSGSVVGSCEHSNGYSGSIKGKEFLDQQSGASLAGPCSMETEKGSCRNAPYVSSFLLLVPGFCTCCYPFQILVWGNFTLLCFIYKNRIRMDVRNRLGCIFFFITQWNMRVHEFYDGVNYTMI